MMHNLCVSEASFTRVPQYKLYNLIRDMDVAQNFYPSSANELCDNYDPIYPSDTDTKVERKAETVSSELRTRSTEFDLVTIDMSLYKDIMANRHAHKIFESMSDKPHSLIWLYKEHDRKVKGPCTAQEMDDLFMSSEFKDTSLVRKYTDKEYHPVSTLIKRYIHKIILSDRVKYNSRIQVLDDMSLLKSSFRRKHDRFTKSDKKNNARDDRIVSEPVRPSLYFLQEIENMENENNSDSETELVTRERSRR